MDRTPHLSGVIVCARCSRLWQNPMRLKGYILQTFDKIDYFFREVFRKQVIHP
jgi:hypothetical protein